MKLKVKCPMTDTVSDDDDQCTHNVVHQVIDAMTAELADSDEKNAQAKQDVIDTYASLSSDEEFLMKLKVKCPMTDTEWEERSKSSALEMEACSKALAFLTSDGAHDPFTRTFNPSIVQEAGSTSSESRTQPSALLPNFPHKLENPRLAALAVKVRLDLGVDVFNKNQVDTYRKSAKSLT